MIPLLLMLAAADAAPQTPVEAERAFAADAKTIGQWTAFRKWSTDDATVFTPQPTKALDWLKDKKDPPKAIDWWPTASWVSCDGTLAVNTGGWARPDGSVGYFTTVWQQQPGGSWKWIVDGGGALTKSRDRPAELEIVKATCRKEPARFVPPPIPNGKVGLGGSKDDSLRWIWWVGANGQRIFSAMYWDGKKYRAVVNDNIPAPK